MEHFDNLQEHTKSVDYAQGTPLWYLIGALMASSVMLISIACVVSVVRGISPTLYNMLNDTTVVAPIAVTAINALQVAHFLSALALYHRCMPINTFRARAQLILASATHVVLLLLMFVLPFLGWSTHWASFIAMLVWGVWEVAVLFALRAIYRVRLARERKLQLASILVFCGYCASCAVYAILYHFDNAFLIVAEVFCSVFAVVFLMLLIVHTVRVQFTVFMAVPEVE